MITQSTYLDAKSKGVLYSLHMHQCESENRGHTFRVSGTFPSIYHQGAVQLLLCSNFLLNVFLKGPAQRYAFEGSPLAHFLMFSYVPQCQTYA